MMMWISDRSIRLPFFASALLIIALAVFYGRMLPVGALHHADEYLTLDRAHSFAIMDDWLTVYSGNSPTFKKPPLQYWMTAWFLERGWDTETAARLPSYLFALALLVNVGVLASLFKPTNGWVIPSAVLLLASSTRFWESAMSALLDIGSALFATAAITAVLLAVRNPKWWYAVALACGLGAWQKAPTPIIFAAVTAVGILVAGRRTDLVFRKSFLNLHFLFALAVMLALVAAWPMLQWVRHGAASLNEAYINQMIERFSPFGDTWDKKFGLDSLLFFGEPFLRAPAIAALLWMPFRLKRPDLLGLPAILAFYIVIVIFATGIVSPRYSLLFLPVMMASLAAVILTVIPEWKGQALALCIFSLIGHGPFKTAGKLDLLENSEARYFPFLMRIAGHMQANESFIVCRGHHGEGRIPAGAISFYASSGKPVRFISHAQDLLELQSSGIVSPPYRGMCSEAAFEDLKTIIPGAVVTGRFEGFLQWESGNAAHLPAD